MSAIFSPEHRTVEELESLAAIIKTKRGRQSPQSLLSCLPDSQGAGGCLGFLLCMHQTPLGMDSLGREYTSLFWNKVRYYSKNVPYYHCINSKLLTCKKVLREAMVKTRQM